MLKQVLITIAMLLVVTIFQTTLCESESGSRTIIVKARLNSDTLIKLLSMGTREFNKVYTMYFVNETIVTSSMYTDMYVDGGKSAVVEYRLVAVYKPWYNPNYILVIGELNDTYVFLKAIEQVVDTSFPTSVLDEVLMNELGLLVYLDIVVLLDDRLEISFINNTVALDRFLIGKTIYSRPAWEQYLDTIHKYRERIPQDYVIMPTQPFPALETPEETRDTYTRSPISLVETPEEREMGVDYKPLLYAFIVALLLTILVYTAFKLM